MNDFVFVSRRDYVDVQTPASRRPHSVDVLQMTKTATLTSAADYWSSEEKYAQQVRQSAAAVTTPRVAREEDISRDVKESALWSYVQPRGRSSLEVPRGRNGEVKENLCGTQEELLSLSKRMTPPRGHNGEVTKWSTSQEDLLLPRGGSKPGLTSPRGLNGEVVKETRMETPPRGLNGEGLIQPRGLNGEAGKETRMVTPPRGLNGEVVKNIQGLTSPRGLNGGLNKEIQELTSPRGRNGDVITWSSSQENLLMATESRGRNRPALTQPRGRSREVTKWSSSQENLLIAQQTQQPPEEEQEEEPQQLFNRSLSARLPRGVKSPLASPGSEVMDSKRFEQVRPQSLTQAQS